MKKIYPFIFIVFCFAAAGCSKDAFKRYERRIVGTWQLVDVDKRGIGGSLSHLPFVDGQFVFEEDGGMTWTSTTGAVYNGSWDIRRRWVSDGCNTNADGNTVCNDRQVMSLSVTAVDFGVQDVKTEYFDEMVFTGTDKFKAYVYSGWHRYVFHFRR